MKNGKGCEGCNSIDGCYETRVIDQYTDYYDERMNECPCGICLIKMVCDEPCEPYEYIWN